MEGKGKVKAKGTKNKNEKNAWNAICLFARRDDLFAWNVSSRNFDSTKRKGEKRKRHCVRNINYLLVIQRYILGSFFFVFSFDKRKSEVINSRNFARRWIPSRIKLMNLFGKE